MDDRTTDETASRRPLDPNEIAELGRLQRNIRIKPAWIAVPLTLWFWPMMTAGPLTDEAFEQVQFPLFQDFTLTDHRPAHDHNQSAFLCG